MVEIHLHPADRAGPLRDAVSAVWAQVFGPIDDLPAWQDTVWERHRAREDFRLVTAHAEGALVGFGWGYTGRPGRFWSDLVIDRLGRTAVGWVGGHFEFVELAVLPAVRGQGLGGRLHDVLLAGLPHERALLGTHDDPDDPAVRLYRSRGWRRLGSQGPGDQVMGKILRSAADAKATSR